MGAISVNDKPEALSQDAKHMQMLLPDPDKGTRCFKCNRRVRGAEETKCEEHMRLTCLASSIVRAS